MIVHVNSILYDRGKVYLGQGMDFGIRLSCPECWYLVDVMLPEQVVARTVLVCSIDNDVIPVGPSLHSAACDCLSKAVIGCPDPYSAEQLYEKLKAFTLYMPPWQWHEIEAALPLFPKVSGESAQHLFELYGGVVRAVLARGHLPAAYSGLQAALSEASPDKILRQVSSPSRKVGCPDE